MNLYKLLVFIIILYCAPCFGYNDCLSEIKGYDPQAVPNVGWQYITYDDGGVKSYCHSRFPYPDNRFILERTNDNFFNTTYVVYSSHCFFGPFGNNNCVIFGRSAWGNTYRATFEPEDIDVRRRILKTSIGVMGYHVCLKRFTPGQTMSHGAINHFKRNAICGYIVNITGCHSAYMGSWGKAYIGCVEEPLEPGPPIYNIVYSPNTSANVDPDVKLESYFNSKGESVEGYLALGSTFDQPLIKLINGKTDGNLMLRYVFDGDPKPRGDYPSEGPIPGGKPENVYKAVVTEDDPTKVCACNKNGGCDNKIYVGCAPRPTPTQSNLKIIAEYSPTKTGDPAINPVFVRTDAKGEILYYDKDGAKVSFDSNGNPYKDGSNGAPANLPITYQRLPLPTTPLNITEYIIQTSPDNDKFYTLVPQTVYGLTFSTKIPMFKTDGTTLTVKLMTPDLRVNDNKDQCPAYKIADDQSESETNPALTYWVPAPLRDTSLCKCFASFCPLQPETLCFNSTRIESHEAEAAKAACPGRFIRAGQEKKGGNKICLSLDISLQPEEVGPDWSTINLHDPDLCTDIPSDCSAQDEIITGYGYAKWPQVPVGTSIEGVCESGYGIEQQAVYKFKPPLYLSEQDFPCDQVKVVGNCSDTYNTYYKPAALAAQQMLNTKQAIANGFEHNLSSTDIKNIKQELGDYAFLHDLEAKLLIPKRSCSIPRGKTNEQGLVENGCMISLGCNEIPQVAEHTGFASWPRNNELSANTMKSIPSVGRMEYNLRTTGTCSLPYRPSSKGPPQRDCRIIYLDGTRIVEQWLDVDNPCIK